jgi:hypothetical protein
VFGSHSRAELIHVVFDHLGQASRQDQP